MKWISLKSKNLPIIALEIERAIQVSASLADAPSPHHELAQLQHHFDLRISQLDQYYAEHSLDENIHIFHMLKVKLLRARLALPQPAPQSSQHPLRILEQPLFTYYDTPPRSPNNIGNQTSNPPVITNNPPVAAINPPSSTNNALRKREEVKPPLKQFTTTQMNSRKQIPVKSRKEEKVYKVETVEKEKVERSERIEKSEKVEREKGEKERGEGEGQRQSELKFTIKMTKEEYRSLLQLKEQIRREGKA